MSNTTSQDSLKSRPLKNLQKNRLKFWAPPHPVHQMGYLIYSVRDEKADCSGCPKAEWANPKKGKKMF